MLTASIVNMKISDNATWADSLQFGAPWDTTWSFTGMSLKCEVKASRDDTSALLTAQTSDNSILILDAATRLMQFNVPDTEIQSDLPVADYVYDLIMEDTSMPPIRTLLCQGTLKVRKGVTED